MRLAIYGMLLLSAGFMCCGDDNSTSIERIDLASIPFTPEPYEFDLPDHFPQMIIPEDNPMTVAGVELGRHLFYDPILSRDSSITCSTCHLPEGNFTDNLDRSIGIDLSLIHI